MTRFRMISSSISGKLLLCFLAFVAMSVVVFMLTINSLRISQNSQERLADVTLPFLNDTQNLARAVSNYIISIERIPLRTLPETGARDLENAEREIETAMLAIENKAADKRSLQHIRDLLSLMQSGAKALALLIVEKKPELNSSIDQKRKEISDALGAIRSALKRLEVKLILNGERAGNALSDIRRLSNNLSGIRVAIDRYNPVFPVSEIRKLQNSYTQAVRDLVTNNIRLRDQETRTSISRQTDILLNHVGTEASFFGNATKLANLQLQTDKAIQSTRTLENRIIGEITTLVRSASTDTTDNLFAISKTIADNIRALIWLMVSSVLIAVGIIVFYVKPSVIGRLNTLVSETQRIVSGNYGTKISTKGDDEITAMSKALETFRNGLIDKERLFQSLLSSNEELERFAYVCSHDLQEPVRMIQAFSEKLEHRISDRIEDDERAQTYLKQVTDAAVRAQKLIRDIMDYSKIEKDIEAFDMVDLNKVVQEALISVKAEEPDAPSQVVFDKLPTITGNKTQMYQLFHNLISNGLKYNEHGADARVEIYSKDLGEMSEITIKDNGIGIEPRHHEKIFEVFRRLHRKEEYPGTGIGLSICKKIVENHRGNITVESSFGQGSEFTFTLLKNAA